MFIRDGSISLAASYQYVERHTESASLTMWVGNPPAGPPDTRTPAPPTDQLELSSEAKTKLAQAEAEEHLGELEGDEALEPKLRLAKLIIEILTGKRIRIFRPKHVHPPEGTAPPDARARQGEAAAAARQGWGVSYTEEQLYSERQDLSFTAEGVVRTRDGQEIKFSLELTASREFTAYHRFDFRAGDAALKDPLVINFDGLATELAATTFQFDLDVDGQAEDLHFLRPGSGFLTLDRNGDGQVTDGSELFGPQTGDGLAELAAHDADGNGWIDEADPVYAQLGVWTKDGAGADLVTPLNQAGVGAIYLNSVGARFDLKDRANTLLGRASRFGVYLTEDGQPRSLQQVDLVV